MVVLSEYSLVDLDLTRRQAAALQRTGFVTVSHLAGDSWRVTASSSGAGSASAPTRTGPSGATAASWIGCGPRRARRRWRGWNPSGPRAWRRSSPGGTESAWVVLAVALAAGLHASRVDGTPLTYNGADPSLPDLLICRPELAPAVLDAVRRLG